MKLTFIRRTKKTTNNFQSRQEICVKNSLRHLLNSKIRSLYFKSLERKTFEWIKLMCTKKKKNKNLKRERIHKNENDHLWQDKIDVETKCERIERKKMSSHENWWQYNLWWFFTWARNMWKSGRICHSSWTCTQKKVNERDWTEVPLDMNCSIVSSSIDFTNLINGWFSQCWILFRISQLPDDFGSRVSERVVGSFSVR